MRKLRNAYLILSGILVQVIRSPKLILSVFSEVNYYIKTARAFKKADTEIQKYETLPIFFQRRESTYDRHYVLQAYWASSIIKKNAPNLTYHADVSSNVSYVVQLSAFIPIHFVEYNPPKLELPSITLIKGDVVHLPFEDETIKSISCMHVLEHIGLGRYGDPIDPLGMKKACRELTRVLAKGGNLLVSFPVGKPKVVLNAHRVLHPVKILEYFPGLRLQTFAMVGDVGGLKVDCNPEEAADMNFACGMYSFIKD
ncbi:MAG: DUF268 domain-containing protein [Bacteroidota bacterium]|jgi:hypothetical protein